MIYLKLFAEFFKIGLFAVGGGQATIPFLTRLSEASGWFTLTDLSNMIAVSESTPGPIGVNMATYVGYSTAGFLGSLFATAGLITPCIAIILMIAPVLKKFRDNKYVNNAFYTLRPASSGIILAALITLVKLCLFDTAAFAASGAVLDLVKPKYLIFFAVLMVLTNIKQLKKLHPICFIALSAVVGIVFKFA